MTTSSGGYKHDASDKKLDQLASTDKADVKEPAAQEHTRHDPAAHDPTGTDRPVKARVQHDDADQASDRNRLEKEQAAHPRHHAGDAANPVADGEAQPPRR